MLDKIDRKDIHRGYDERYHTDNEIEIHKYYKQDTMIDGMFTMTEKYYQMIQK